MMFLHTSEFLIHLPLLSKFGHFGEPMNSFGENIYELVHRIIFRKMMNKGKYTKLTSP
jgi:hypothetical protein